MLVPMIVARSGVEQGNIEWLEKLQCSSGVPIIVKSFMFVIDNHANKNRLIKNLVIFVPTKLSSLAFSSSPFRSIQSRSVLFRSVLDNDIETQRTFLD